MSRHRAREHTILAYYSEHTNRFTGKKVLWGTFALSTYHSSLGGCEVEIAAFMRRKDIAWIEVTQHGALPVMRVIPMLGGPQKAPEDMSWRENG